MAKYRQGKFKPKNPHKYDGDASDIVYRSGWELKFCMYLDSHPEIISWSSEEVIIPYISPIDGKKHRYFVDFKVTKIGKDKKKETLLIEIKPAAQTAPPDVTKKLTPQGKMRKRYLTEVKTWGVNSAKWKYAKAYCESKGWKFVILTEKELGIK